jgi:hypothetical protein
MHVRTEVDQSHPLKTDLSTSRLLLQLGSSSPDKQAQAVLQLEEITKNGHKIAADAVRVHACNVVEIMCSSHDSTVQSSCALVLARAAAAAPFGSATDADRAAIATVPGCLQALVQLLQSRQPEVCAAAAAALWSLAYTSAASNAIAVIPGCMQQLLILLTGSDPAVKHNSLQLIANLACALPQIRASIARMPGCVGGLVALLSVSACEPVSVQQAAVSVLHNLATAAEVRAAVVSEPGSVQALVRLLSRPDASLLSVAVRTVRSLTRDHAAAIAAVPGCFDALSSLLSSSDAAVQRAASSILCNLVSAAPEVGAAAAAVAETLVGLLCSTDADVSAAAATALESLANSDPANKAAIIALPATEASVVGLLSGSMRIFKKRAALSLLECLVEGPAEPKTGIAGLKLLSSLSGLLRFDDKVVQQAAASVLGTLAEDCPAAAAAIAATPGCLSGLVCLLQSDSLKLQALALQVVLQLARNGAAAAVVAAPRCLDNLTVFEHSWQSGLQLHPLADMKLRVLDALTKASWVSWHVVSAHGVLAIQLGLGGMYYVVHRKSDIRSLAWRTVLRVLPAALWAGLRFSFALVMPHSLGSWLAWAAVCTVYAVSVVVELGRTNAAGAGSME